MSTALLELASVCLGDLTDQVVFLGGASIGLWISDAAAPPVRATNDVDVVIGATYQELDTFAADLRRRAFREDRTVICRYHHPDGLVLDVMPIDPMVLGFGNQWYREAVVQAAAVVLPSGRMIRALRPPWLVATKLEAYLDRALTIPSRAPTSRTWCASWTAALNSLPRSPSRPRRFGTSSPRSSDGSRGAATSKNRSRARSRRTPVAAPVPRS